MTVLSPMVAWQRPRLLACLLGLASAACLATAFWFQHVAGLEPCPLCIDQRWAHGASITVAAVSVVCMAPERAAIMLAALALTFLAGTGIAAWHVMVEWHWVASPGCSIPEFGDMSVDSFLSMDVVRCDEVAWSMAGVSMAGWNAIVSLMLATVAITGSLVSLRGRR
ncbi:MAG: disulfide bond formation protein B [bacterium]|nr:disulfide bond formation protein B [bacterium]